MEINIGIQYIWLIGSFIASCVFALSAGLFFDKADKICADDEKPRVSDALPISLGIFFVIATILHLVAFVRIMHYMIGEVTKST